jgi:hypothetical protein
MDMYVSAANLLGRGADKGTGRPNPQRNRPSVKYAVPANERTPRLPGAISVRRVRIACLRLSTANHAALRSHNAPYLTP